MNNRNSKIAIGIASIFEIILIITVIFNITSKEWSKLPLTLITILCTILPFIITKIANKKNIILPTTFQLILVLFILLTLYFGEIKNFYIIFWWWDLLLHGFFGSYAVIIAFHLIQGIIAKEKEVTKERFITFTSIFAFSFSITLGTLWEIFEFLGDYFFKTDMVNGGLGDTASDLIIKVIAAFSTAITCYYRKLNNYNK